MTEYTFENLAPGDIIKTHRTVEVLLKEHDEIFFRDVGTGQLIYLDPREGVDHGSLLYEIVSKAKPPKPKVGDTVTGHELFDLPWPTGTVVKSDWSYLAYIREATGEWRCPGSVMSHADYISSDIKFTILHIPTKGNSNG